MAVKPRPSQQKWLLILTEQKKLKQRLLLTLYKVASVQERIYTAPEQHCSVDRRHSVNVIPVSDTGYCVNVV